MVAEAVQDELSRRNLTVHGFAERYGFDRNTFSRFAKKGRATLEMTERWARTMNLDVNQWRELCGFTRVEETDPNRALETAMGKAPELTYDPDFSDFDLRNYEGPRLQGFSEEDIDFLNQLQRAAMTERRRKQGRE